MLVICLNHGQSVFFLKDRFGPPLLIITIWKTQWYFCKSSSQLSAMHENDLIIFSEDS